MIAHPCVDIVLLSGFLGSGKTTLLGSFLRTRALQDTAVIVNEVGEIGIDSAVLHENVQSDDILMLDNGCVCCSLRSSLVDTILRLLRMPRPDGYPPLKRIVVETSGLSKPGPIVASLRDRELVGLNLRLLVISTFDCTRVDDATYLADEALAQWAACHRLVLTKLDCLTNEADRARVAQRASALSPLAQLINSLDPIAQVNQTFEPLDEAAPDVLPTQISEQIDPKECEMTDLGLAHADLLVLHGQAQTPLSWDEFAQWVDDMAGLCGDRLLRFKALVKVQGVEQPVLLQSVGTTFSAPITLTHSKAADSRSIVILIARQMTLQDFKQHLPETPISLSLFAVPSRRARRVFDVPIVH